MQRQEIFLILTASLVSSVTLVAPLLQVTTLVMCTTLRSRRGLLTMISRCLKSKRLLCRAIGTGVVISSFICTRRSLMSCWKRKRILRHLAWKWGRPLVRPCEEQTSGLAVCTAYSFSLLPTSPHLCRRRIQNST